jgi:hypothetical protein
VPLVDNLFRKSIWLSIRILIVVLGSLLKLGFRHGQITLYRSKIDSLVNISATSQPRLGLSICTFESSGSKKCNSYYKILFGESAVG